MTPLGKILLVAVGGIVIYSGINLINVIHLLGPKEKQNKRILDIEKSVVEAVICHALVVIIIIAAYAWTSL